MELKNISPWITSLLIVLLFPCESRSQGLIVRERYDFFIGMNSMSDAVLRYLKGDEPVEAVLPLFNSDPDEPELERLREVFQKNIPEDYWDNPIRQEEAETLPVKWGDIDPYFKAEPAIRVAFFRKTDDYGGFEMLLQVEAVFQQDAASGDKGNYKIKSVRCRSNTVAASGALEVARHYYSRLPKLGSKALQDSIVNNGLVFAEAAVLNNNACLGDTMKVRFSVFVKKGTRVPSARILMSQGFKALSPQKEQIFDKLHTTARDGIEYHTKLLESYIVVLSEPGPFIIDGQMMETVVDITDYEQRTDLEYSHPPELVKVSVPAGSIEISGRVCK